MKTPRAFLQSLSVVVLVVVSIAAASARAANSPQERPSLSLSDAQVAAMKRIKSESEKQAAPLAVQLAAVAKRIYENMLSDKEDQKLRRRLSLQMNGIAGKLLAIKGQSIRDTVAVLTPEQKRTLRDEMRKPGAPADLTELISKLFAGGK
jgi:hypothetical protein